jgi:hypothetical protein
MNRIFSRFPVIIVLIILVSASLIVVGEGFNNVSTENSQLEHSTYYPKYNNSSVEIADVIIMPNGTKYVLWSESATQMKHKHITGIYALDSNNNELWRTYMSCSVRPTDNTGQWSLLTPQNFAINEYGDILISILSSNCDNNITLFVNELVVSEQTGASTIISMIVSLNSSDGRLNWFKAIDKKLLNFEHETYSRVGKLRSAANGNPILITTIFDYLHRFNDSSISGQGTMMLNLTRGVFKHGGGGVDTLIVELNRTDGSTTKKIAISSKCEEYFDNMVVDENGGIWVSILSYSYRTNTPRELVKPDNFSILGQELGRCHIRHQTDDPPLQIHKNDPEFHLFLIDGEID